MLQIFSGSAAPIDLFVDFTLNKRARIAVASLLEPKKASRNLRASLLEYRNLQQCTVGGMLYLDNHSYMELTLKLRPETCCATGEGCRGNPFCPYRIFKKLGTLWAKRLQQKPDSWGEDV